MEPLPLMALPCMCANLRRATRALTAAYDAALRPYDIRVTQFTILQALRLVGEISQGKLADLLATDGTTLTRTLGGMERRKWIARRSGADRRERRFRLAAAGEVLLRSALPLWEGVQERFRSQLTPTLQRQFTPFALAVTAAAQLTGAHAL